MTAEKMPAFKRGDLNTFRTWVQSHIRYPVEARKHHIEGVVTVAFVVETDGSVTVREVLHSPSQLLSDEVCRVLNESPRWEPGMQDGKPVRFRFNLPILFRL